VVVKGRGFCRWLQIQSTIEIECGGTGDGLLDDGAKLPADRRPPTERRRMAHHRRVSRSTGARSFLKSAIR